MRDKFSMGTTVWTIPLAVVLNYIQFLIFAYTCIDTENSVECLSGMPTRPELEIRGKMTLQ